MQISINCSVTLPRALVKELQDEFGLTPKDGKLQFDRHNYLALETILTEWASDRRAKNSSVEMDKLVNERLQMLVTLANNAGLGLASAGPNPSLSMGMVYPQFVQPTPTLQAPPAQLEAPQSPPIGPDVLRQMLTEVVSSMQPPVQSSVTPAPPQTAAPPPAQDEPAKEGHMSSSAKMERLRKIKMN